jgi:hypothetical protein
MQTNVDLIAKHLIYLGKLGRTMPPAWDGAKCTSLACGPDGQYFGKVLPGRGLYLAHDLKALGIKKPLPNVYERSPLFRTIEAMDIYGQIRGKVLDAEKSAVKFLSLLNVVTARLVPACAITTYDSIITARANGKYGDVTGTKVTAVTVANGWHSLYALAGTPAAGAFTNIPGGSVKDKTDAGAYSLGLTNPTAPDKMYLLTIGISANQQTNMLILVDLLVAAGNILATTAAAQTVNSVALNRYTTGAGVLATLEITTLMSATAHNLTLNSYTNQAGTAARTTGAQTGLNAGIVGRLDPSTSLWFQLQSGDYGVRSVEQFTCSAALAAGVYALHLFYPLAFLPGIAANGYVERDSTVQIDGVTELVQTSGNVLGCLTAYLLPSATASGQITTFMRTVTG